MVTPPTDALSESALSLQGPRSGLGAAGLGSPSVGASSGWGRGQWAGVLPEWGRGRGGAKPGAGRAGPQSAMGRLASARGQGERAMSVLGNGDGLRGHSAGVGCEGESSVERNRGS